MYEGLVYKPKSLKLDKDGALTYTMKDNSGSHKPEKTVGCDQPFVCCNNALLKKVGESLPCKSNVVLKATRVADDPPLRLKSELNSPAPIGVRAH
jgi:hypothetical protein